MDMDMIDGTGQKEPSSNRPGFSGTKNKRNRQSNSCVPCKNRKVKVGLLVQNDIQVSTIQAPPALTGAVQCDRGRPCESCSRAHHPNACVYTLGTAAPPTKRRQSSGKTATLDRLNSLEHLLLQIVEKAGPQDGTKRLPEDLPNAHKSVSEASSPKGHLLLNGDESTYIGSIHWSTIMDSVKDLKARIVYEDTSIAHDLLHPDSDMLLCTPRALCLDTVLQVLPPRQETDRYLRSYFGSKYLASPIIHANQFGRQYERFWTNPRDTPVLWISILMSMLSASARLTDFIDASPEREHRIMQQKFLTAAAQCLMLGNYTRPKPLVVEALLLFCQCQVGMTLDPSREAAIIFSVLTRLAFRCGYHRDPDNLRTLSVFDGEMRRRTWALCKNTDLLIATQVGLPQNIPDDYSDTRPPSNISDEDFDEDVLHLPLSKPEAEPTQMVFLLVKDRLMTVFSKIIRVSISFAPFSTGDLTQLDDDLRLVHDSIPLALRVRPLSQSFTDTTTIIMWRFVCDIIYQKCLCLLHRRLMVANANHSNEIIIEAAAIIQKHIIELYREFQPGGQLQNDSWMLSAALVHDFLLGTMILAISVSEDIIIPPRPNQNDQRQNHLELLKMSHSVCVDLSFRSREAQRVATALESMLPELRLSSVSRRESEAEGSSAAYAAEIYTPSYENTSTATDSQAACKESNLTDQFDISFEGAEDVDWTFLDQFFQVSNSNMFRGSFTAAALSLN